PGDSSSMAIWTSRSVNFSPSTVATTALGSTGADAAAGGGVCATAAEAARTKEAAAKTRAKRLKPAERSHIIEIDTSSGGIGPRTPDTGLKWVALTTLGGVHNSPASVR